MATVVSNSLNMKEGTIANLTIAYHMGFITSLIFMLISIIPTFFLTNKLRKMNNADTDGGKISTES